MGLNFKNETEVLYLSFLKNRQRFVKPMLFASLIFCIIVGAGYRSVALKNEFGYASHQIAAYISMASFFGSDPGLYSLKDFLLMTSKPEKYIYTIGRSPNKPDRFLKTEFGWALILNCILKDNIRGLRNIALSIAKYQLMIDIVVFIILFFVGLKLAGGIGGFSAAYLYAVFKIPISLMTIVVYYYWPIPFSALSLLFLTIVLKPKEDVSASNTWYFKYIIWGVLIGFAASVRHYFLFLPIFLAPLFFIRSRSWKKGIILFLMIIIGQMIVVAPTIMLNKKHVGEYAIVTRGFWHLFIQGVGLYKNPWGIKDSGDVTANEWAMARGSPSMFGSTESQADAWFKKQYFKMLKEHPEVFIGNFLKHLYRGLTVGAINFEFVGLIDQGSRSAKLLKNIFPWMVLSAFILLFFFSRDVFWTGLLVVAQGLFLLLVIVTWFSNYTNFLSGYIPVFTLLLGISIGVHVKVVLAFIESGIRCWIWNKGFRELFKDALICYQQKQLDSPS